MFLLWLAHCIEKQLVDIVNFELLLFVRVFNAHLSHLLLELLHLLVLLEQESGDNLGDNPSAGLQDCFYFRVGKRGFLGFERALRREFKCVFDLRLQFEKNLVGFGELLLVGVVERDVKENFDLVRLLEELKLQLLDRVQVVLFHVHD